MKLVDKDKNQLYKPSILKMLNKLISEEWFAGQMYKLFINAVKLSDKHIIAGLLDAISEDELEDHMESLIKEALKFGYDVPSSFAQFQKYAGEDDVSAFVNAKDNKTAFDYIKVSIESEKRAIESYAEALKNKDLDACIDIKLVLENNYYDELDHLTRFSFIMKTLDVEANVEDISQGLE